MTLDEFRVGLALLAMLLALVALTLSVISWLKAKRRLTPFELSYKYTVEELYFAMMGAHYKTMSNEHIRLLVALNDPNNELTPPQLRGLLNECKGGKVADLRQRPVRH